MYLYDLIIFNNPKKDNFVFTMILKGSFLHPGNNKYLTFLPDHSSVLRGSYFLIFFPWHLFFLCTFLLLVWGDHSPSDSTKHRYLSHSMCCAHRSKPNRMFSPQCLTAVWVSRCPKSHLSLSSQTVNSRKKCWLKWTGNTSVPPGYLSLRSVRIAMQPGLTPGWHLGAGRLQGPSFILLLFRLLACCHFLSVFPPWAVSLPSASPSTGGTGPPTVPSSPSSLSACTHKSPSA